LYLNFSRWKRASANGGVGLRDDDDGSGCGDSVVGGSVEVDSSTGEGVVGGGAAQRGVAGAGSMASEFPEHRRTQLNERLDQILPMMMT
jgi:hypothetical protein